jgi:capsule polysaccharide export protein KpsE/RkpR
MSATPKDGSAKKPAAPRAPAAESREEADRREAEGRKADAESVRARWRDAQQGLGAAERRLTGIEEEMKTLPPGLPAGNYYDDIRAAVDQQKVEREQRLDLAKKARTAAKEALDAVEIEARRKQIRLD